MSRLYTRDAKAYPVTSQCKLLGVSTQAYYKHGNSQMRKLAEEAFVVEFIRNIRKKDRGMGGGPLWHKYTDTFGEEHSVGDTLEAKFAIEALNMALKRLGGNPAHDLIHHSDRGVQYASYAYTDILKENNIKISMTECGDPKENAVAERVNGIIKNELLMGMSFFSIDEVKRALKVAIDFYNNERPHMSLDWKTPAQAALCTGELKKKWKSHREIALKALAA